MPQVSQEQEEDKTYHKRIDELIEDAEIEAEIEAEKKIRSKNTRILTISLVAVALIAFIYLQVKTGSQTTSPGEHETGPLPELAKSPVDVQPPVSQEQSQKTVQGPESADASKASTTPGEKKQEQEVTTAETETTAPAVPDKKPEEPVVAQVPPKAPAPDPVEKPEVAEIVKQPAKSPPAKVTTARQYHVQLGVFSIEDNAKRLVKSIQAKGFKPSIQTKTIEASRYVVFVGGFSSKDDGNQAITELKTKGFDPVMEKFENNSHTIVLGKFKTASEAEALRDQLSINGFLSSAKKIRVQTNIHIVQLGPFDSLPQAKRTQRNIEQAGFNNGFIH